jgi:hypothetical protein
MSSSDWLQAFFPGIDRELADYILEQASAANVLSLPLVIDPEEATIEMIPGGEPMNLQQLRQHYDFDDSISDRDILEQLPNMIIDAVPSSDDTVLLGELLKIKNS